MRRPIFLKDKGSKFGIPSKHFHLSLEIFFFFPPKMAEGPITVLDGTHLRDIDLTPPFSDSVLTGAHLLDLADSTASSSLFGIPLPETLKSSALNIIGLHDIVAFRRSELTSQRASQILKDYVSAIADILRGILLFMYGL